ncbi:MAG: isoamylase early set domain-containing protein [Flavobacterium sp.]
MAIKKQFIKSKPVCKVTFSIEAKEATTASVVGDFNGWDPEVGALGKLKNGTFKGTFELPASTAYEFRYIVDGQFINDEEADAYKWNDFASAENSVVEV